MGFFKSRLGWAVVSKTTLAHWLDKDGREQFDVFVDKDSAEKAESEWEQATGEKYAVVRCRIEPFSL